MLDRSIAPLHSSSYHIDFPKVKPYRLSSGIDAFTLNAGTQPVVKIEVIYPHGGSYYEHKRASSLVALKMLKEGTRSYSSSQLSNQFAQYGAFIEVNPSFDVPTISLYCLSRHVDLLLPYFSEIINDPGFPAVELKRILQIEIQQLRLQNEKTSVLASKRFRNLLFGDQNPYGKIISEEDLKELNETSLQEFFKSNLGEYKILISGQIEPAVVNVIDSCFGGIEISQPNVPLPEYSSSDERSVVREDRPGALQSSIRMGRQVIDKGASDYIPLLVTSHVLGGYFGSRLMKNIREDKGYTYGIYSSVVPLQHHPYMVIGTDVKKEYVSQTLEEINKELQDLCNNRISENELSAVKNHMLGHFQSQLNSPFTLMDKFKDIHIHSLNYDYYDKYLSTIENIDSHQILGIANKYLHPENMKTVVIG